MFAQNSSSSFAHLDDETRDKLVELLDARVIFATHAAQLNRLRAAAVRDPNPANLQAVDNYTTDHIVPLRESMQPLILHLLESAVKADEIKAMLPMLLMAVSQKVDIPLLMTTFGLEPDMIAAAITDIQDYFRQGM